MKYSCLIVEHSRRLFLILKKCQSVTPSLYVSLLTTVIVKGLI